MPTDVVRADRQGYQHFHLSSSEDPSNSGCIQEHLWTVHQSWWRHCVRPQQLWWLHHAESTQRSCDQSHQQSRPRVIIPLQFHPLWQQCLHGFYLVLEDALLKRCYRTSMGVSLESTQWNPRKILQGSLDRNPQYCILSSRYFHGCHQFDYKNNQHQIWLSHYAG